MATFPQGGWIQAGTATNPLILTPAASSKSDYAGFDLALGEIHGLRFWKIDVYGRLRARNWDKADPWKPGVNIARCEAQQPVPTAVEGVIDPTGQGRKAVTVDVQMDLDMQTFVPRKIFKVTWDDGTKSTHPTLRFTEGTDGRHAAPHEDCQCGFYAYTDVDHEEIEQYAGYSEFVLGIIKGTGRTLIGTRGFRCEKAEIVALRDPTRGGKKTDSWRTQQRKKLERVYPDVPLLPSRAALLEFADIEPQFPDPATDEFWSLP